MEKVGILFGSSTGNTEGLAKKIADKIEEGNADLLNVADIDVADIDKYSNLIIGTSTWGFGDLQDDWEDFLSKLKSANLDGKTVAFYGLGDSSAYPDTFVDAMGLIYEEIKDKDINHIGKTPIDEYTFEESKAVVNNEFVGLAIDEDSESDQTDTRLNNWLKVVLPNLK